MTTYTDKQIREFFGHNGHECRVRITRDGMVRRYGSPTDADRSKDYWHDLGTRELCIEEMDRTCGCDECPI